MFRQGDGPESMVAGDRGGPGAGVLASAKPRVTVTIHAADAMLRTGVTQQLVSQRDLLVLADHDSDTSRADVSLVVVDRVDDDTLLLLNRLRHQRTAVGLIASTLGAGALEQVIASGAHALLRRAEAGPERLAALVRAAAAGEGMLPGDLIGQLIAYVTRLQQAAPESARSLATLTRREADMLGLVAEGFDTREIAAKTSYSERTVKNVLHEVTTRLDLRNRTHAVGYALRHGLI
ncbi:LuxR C-terminal-related transcriptional regulator [Streptomyces sp. NPDC001941]|uniref:helix-turn-helix transcriptional regulator n=1 Tax=Streptomyces sp. NPDC001941 TaxID=3154659 RepID=UPI00332370D0